MFFKYGNIFCLISSAIHIGFINLSCGFVNEILAMVV